MRPRVALTSALMLLCYLACDFPYAARSAPFRVLEGYVGAQATAVAALIRLFDPSAELRGHLVSGVFALEVIRDCTSLDAQGLLVAAILGFPARIRHKALGIGLGLLLVNVANVVRIAALYGVGARWPSWFDATHEELMPFAMVVLTCAAFAGWASHVLRSEGVRHV